VTTLHAASRRVLLISTALALGVLGCDGGTTTPVGATPSSVEEGCIQLGEAWADSMSQCASLTLYSRDGNEGNDARSSLEWALANGWCAAASAAATAAQTRGALRIDLVALGACAARLRTTSGCEGFATFYSFAPWSSPFDACPAALVANGDEGAPCVSRFECRSGFYCDAWASGGCPGACRKKLPLDAECDLLDSCAGKALCMQGRCEAGTQCDATPADEFYWPATCRALVPAGGPNAPCSIVGDDGKYHVCPAGTWCRMPSDETQGTCVATPGRGDTCIDAVPCAMGLVCIGGICGDGLPEGATCQHYDGDPCLFGGDCTGGSTEGTCQKYWHEFAGGDACTSDRDCASRACVAGHCLTFSEVADSDPCGMRGI
jgi:hypothetical protein